MTINELDQFKKEKKRFARRYRHLDEDLKIALKILDKLPEGNQSKHWDILHVSKDGRVKILKTRLSSRDLKGQDRFRLIYGLNRRTEPEGQIDLIELYLKGEKDREDQSRIKDYLKALDFPD